ncbi:GIY-YIG nuclease family protein [Halogeometricum limi]|uniref:DUF7662 domain-containing protein n=1 Tax=Halogeometricum limi TaxID=555875 RepID=A0A1I6HIG2_9EURY|nr:GIY-YIG nuclease family protein [Halogeometricum limi]SFR54259.1 hypothetical protein SAMN04488124_2286 [Halogeometricum limi]
MELSGYAFDRVCDVEPDRTDRGVLDVSVPQPEYARRDEKAVHDHGWGPFCTFDVPDDGTRRPGVYAVVVADEVTYVGETADLYERFANGYGRISPANCFEGGQGTNCRLNTEIFHAARAGDRVTVFLHATDDFDGTDEENRTLRRLIKGDVLEARSPAWNLTGADDEREGDGGGADAGDGGGDETDGDNETDRGGETDGGPDSPTTEPDRGVDARGDTDRLTDEFAGLYDYLVNHDRDRVERTFAELEVVVDDALPTQARRWRRWWTNDAATHPHARAWLAAGYEVTDVSLQEGRIAFERSESTARDATPRASPRRRE